MMQNEECIVNMAANVKRGDMALDDALDTLVQYADKGWYTQATREEYQAAIEAINGAK